MIRSERPALFTASRADSSIFGSRSSPTALPPGPSRFASATRCPPPPAVPSTRTALPGRCFEDRKPSSDLVNQHRLVNRSHGGFRGKKRSGDPAAAGNRHVQQATLAQLAELSRLESDDMRNLGDCSCKLASSGNVRNGATADVRSRLHLARLRGRRIRQGAASFPGKQGYTRLGRLAHNLRGGDEGYRPEITQAI